MRTPWSSRVSQAKSRRKSPPAGWRRWRLFLVPAMGLAVVLQFTAGVSARATTDTSAASATTAASGAVALNPVNELDCNGWSDKYSSVRQLAGDLCTDPIKITNGKAT